MKSDPGRGLTAERVTANGRRFHTVRAGDGEPLVVFEAGLAAGASLWAEVQRKVAEHTATLAYDRAGYGGSQRAKDGRRLADFNADLEAVLDAIEHDGPVILVGQSWGGPTIRAFSHYTRRPVAGLVIVDGTNSTVVGPTEGKGLRVFFGILGKLTWVQLHRKPRGKLLKGITAGLDADDSKRVVRDMLRARSVRAGAAEARGFEVEIDGGLAALEAKGFPPGVPVTFMGAAVAEPGTEEMRARFIASQQEEAEALGHRYVRVDDSRHDIHMQRPDLVIQEVLALVERRRGGS